MFLYKVLCPGPFFYEIIQIQNIQSLQSYANLIIWLQKIFWLKHRHTDWIEGKREWCDWKNKGYQSKFVKKKRKTKSFVQGMPLRLWGSPAKSLILNLYHWWVEHKTYDVSSTRSSMYILSLWNYFMQHAPICWKSKQANQFLLASHVNKMSTCFLLLAPRFC